MFNSFLVEIASMDEMLGAILSASGKTVEGRMKDLRQ